MPQLRPRRPRNSQTSDLEARDVEQSPMATTQHDRERRAGCTTTTNVQDTNNDLTCNETVSNQPEIPSPCAEIVSQGGLSVSSHTAHVKEKRQKWTNDERKELIWCFHYCTLNPSQNSNTNSTFQLWKTRNPELAQQRSRLDPNKLATVRRDIINNKRLSDQEIDAIKRDVNRIMEENDHVVMTPEQTIASPVIQNEDTRAALQAHPQDQLNAGNDETDERWLEMEAEIMKTWQDVQQVATHDRIPLRKLRNQKSLKRDIMMANNVLLRIKTDTAPLSMESLNQLVYATAVVLTSRQGVKLRARGNAKKQRREPKWKIRLQKDIEKMRKDLSILHANKMNPDARRLQEKTARICSSRRNNDVVTLQEELKQRIAAKAQRIKRYLKKEQVYQQNKLFQENPKVFYRNLAKESVKVTQVPQEEEVATFWKKIWEVEKPCNLEADWIRKQEEKLEDVPSQEWEPITVEEVSLTLKQTSNWKSPGVDQLHNFWLKKMTVLHADLADTLNQGFLDAGSLPDWFTEGITSLLPKNDDTRNPKNYRPITCLSTSYKLLTSIINSRVYHHLIQFDLLPLEQKGCRKDSYGCKDQLLTNKAIMLNCKKKLKNLSMAWIDYRKAFDSVPHAWIRKVAEMYKFHPALQDFLQASMSR